MSIPPNVGPNVALLLQRLDLIEKKVDWVAQRVSWLTYSAARRRQKASSSQQMEAFLRLPCRRLPRVSWPSTMMLRSRYPPKAQPWRNQRHR